MPVQFQVGKIQISEAVAGTNHEEKRNKNDKDHIGMIQVITCCVKGRRFKEKKRRLDDVVEENLPGVSSRRHNDCATGRYRWWVTAVFSFHQTGNLVLVVSLAAFNFVHGGKKYAAGCIGCRSR
jgi:hypothetical protein